MKYFNFLNKHFKYILFIWHRGVLHLLWLRFLDLGKNVIFSVLRKLLNSFYEITNKNPQLSTHSYFNVPIGFDVLMVS